MSRSYQEAVWEQVVQLVDRVTTLFEQVTNTGMSVSDAADSMEKTMERLAKQMESIEKTPHAPEKSQDSTDLGRLLDEKLADLSLNSVEMESQLVEGIVTALKPELDKTGDQMREMFGYSLDELITEVRNASQEGIRKAKDVSRFKWLSVTCGTVFLLMAFSVFGTWKYVSMQYQASTRDVERLLATDSGRAAMNLAGLNDMQAMLECRNFKTIKQDGRVYCIPMNEKKEVTGWRIK